MWFFLSFEMHLIQLESDQFTWALLMASVDGWVFFLLRKSVKKGSQYNLKNPVTLWGFFLLTTIIKLLLYLQNIRKM